MNKTTKFTAIVVPLMAIAFIAMAFSFSNEQNDNKWEVPAAMDKMKNPTTPNAADLKVGKNLYAQHCKSCHGSDGMGEGPKAAELDTPCGDFSSADFQSQTDGALFYKTREGRDEMPSFKKKLSEDEDVWLVVNYIRTLSEE